MDFKRSVSAERGPSLPPGGQSRVAWGMRLACKVAFVAALIAMPFVAQLAATQVGLEICVIVWAFYAISAIVLKSQVIARALIGLLIGGVLGEFFKPAVTGGNPFEEEVWRMFRWAMWRVIVGFAWGVLAENARNRQSRGWWPLPLVRGPMAGHLAGKDLTKRLDAGCDSKRPLDPQCEGGP